MDVGHALSAAHGYAQDGQSALRSRLPCVGVCDILRMDNEKAFRSRSMALAAGSLNFQIDYGPAGQSRLLLAYELTILQFKTP